MLIRPYIIITAIITLLLATTTLAQSDEILELAPGETITREVNGVEVIFVAPDDAPLNISITESGFAIASGGTAQVITPAGELELSPGSAASVEVGDENAFAFTADAGEITVATPNGYLTLNGETDDAVGIAIGDDDAFTFSALVGAPTLAQVTIDEETGEIVPTETQVVFEAGSAIRTLVDLVEEQVPLLDENGDPVLNDDGEEVTQTVIRRRNRVAVVAGTAELIGPNFRAALVQGQAVAYIAREENDEGTNDELVVEETPPDTPVQMFIIDEDGEVEATVPAGINVRVGSTTRTEDGITENRRSIRLFTNPTLPAGDALRVRVGGVNVNMERGGDVSLEAAPDGSVGIQSNNPDFAVNLEDDAGVSLGTVSVTGPVVISRNLDGSPVVRQLSPEQATELFDEEVSLTSGGQNIASSLGGATTP